MKEQIDILYRIQKIDTVIKKSEEHKKRSAEEMQTAEQEYRRAEAQHQTVQEHVESFQQRQTANVSKAEMPCAYQDIQAHPFQCMSPAWPRHYIVYTKKKEISFHG